MNAKVLLSSGLLMGLLMSTSANAVTILSDDFTDLSGWTIVDNIAGASWGLSGDAGNETDNWTGGTGTAASVSSDAFGVAAYDTELRSSLFSLDGFSAASLDFLVNYQAIGTTPTDGAFDVEISTNGGASFATLFSFANDTPVGGLRTAPGDAINLDLAAYLGESSLVLSFHYYNADPGAFDWYAQIDDLLIEGTPTSTGVPEPGILMLLGLGLAGLGFARRRS